MEPLYGFLLYLAASTIVSIVASKRGRSGILFFIAMIAFGFGMVVFIARIGGTQTMAGFAAFLAPLVGLAASLSMRTAQQIAVDRGAFGDFKKCPDCAEPVRREAIKCKHCGSALERAEIVDQSDLRALAGQRE